VSMCFIIITEFVFVIKVGDLFFFICVSWLSWRCSGCSL